MSLLGFDALGRWALAQLPGNGNFALLTVKGSIALVGAAAAFKTSGVAAVGGFTLVGPSARFVVAEPASMAAFALAGNAAAFKSSETASGGSFALTGAAAKSALRVVASPGAISSSKIPIRLSVSLASVSAAFTWAGGGSSYSRDHEAWIRRPFDTMSWQTETALTPLAWSRVAPTSNAWIEETPPANAWTPALIESEPWTNE